jgi:hypothetical protein
MVNSRGGRNSSAQVLSGMNSPTYGLCGTSHVQTDRQDDPCEILIRHYVVHRQLARVLCSRALTPSSSTTPTYCLLSTVYCLLSTVYYLLSTTYYLLSATYYLLPTTYCPLFAALTCQPPIFHGLKASIPRRRSMGKIPL